VNKRNPIDLAGVLRWHVRLTGNPVRQEDGSVGPAGEGDKGGLADLRRATTVDDVLLSPAFASLVVETTTDDPGRWILLALARTAFVLSRVDRCAVNRRYSTLMATHRAGKPTVSTLRANTLFRLEDTGEACLQIASLLPLFGPRGTIEVDAADILAAARWWDSTRRRWATDYHTQVLRAAARAAAD
jgi:CRISPR type I-E-associated protein CasB/Cse2